MNDPLIIPVGCYVGVALAVLFEIVSYVLREAVHEEGGGDGLDHSIRLVLILCSSPLMALAWPVSTPLFVRKFRKLRELRDREEAALSKPDVDLRVYDDNEADA